MDERRRERWRVLAQGWGSAWTLHDETEPFERWALASHPDLTIERVSELLRIPADILAAWAAPHELLETRLVIARVAENPWGMGRPFHTSHALVRDRIEPLGWRCVRCGIGPAVAAIHRPCGHHGWACTIGESVEIVERASRVRLAPPEGPDVAR